MRVKRNLPRAVAVIAVIAFAAAYVSTAQAVATFTIVGIPDSQDAIQNNSARCQQQVDWILANQASQKIAFVAHHGDIVNNGSSGQFNTAHNIYFQLNNASPDLPWGTCQGNHDSSSNYDSYFGPSNFTGKGWYGATTNSHSSYQTFQAGGRNYLVLDLQYQAGSSALTWAQGIINTHPNMPTIINTHEYLQANGTRSTYGDTLWNGLVKGSPQVFMVLCGHLDYTQWTGSHQTSTNNDGKAVYEIMADYQYDWEPFGGYLRTNEFDEDHSVIRVRTFLPSDGSTLDRGGYELHNFDLEMDFDERLGVVPEPSTAVLAAISAAAFLGYGWWQRKQRARP